MDEFQKITPAGRQILDMLCHLKPYEQLVIQADKDGKFDTFWIKQETKVRLVGLSLEFTK